MFQSQLALAGLAKALCPRLQPNGRSPSEAEELAESSAEADQRGVGFPRKKDGNFDGVAVVDIGAFEW